MRRDILIGKPIFPSNTGAQILNTPMLKTSWKNFNDNHVINKIFKKMNKNW